MCCSLTAALWEICYCHTSPFDASLVSCKLLFLDFFMGSRE